jgi:hypothetical protein
VDPNPKKMSSDPQHWLQVMSVILTHGPAPTPPLSGELAGFNQGTGTGTYYDSNIALAPFRSVIYPENVGRFEVSR